MLETSEIAISEIALCYEIEPTQLYVLAVRGAAQLEIARGPGAVTRLRHVDAAMSCFGSCALA